MSVWVFMRSYGSLWFFIGPLGCYGSWSISVFYFPYGFLWDLMGSFKSLLVLNGLYGSLLACLHVHFWESVLSYSA